MLVISLSISVIYWTVKFPDTSAERLEASSQDKTQWNHGLRIPCITQAS